jgi:hypothetical protein
MRELQQAARLRRTPYAIAVLTALAAFIVASVGGVASSSKPPAAVGVGLYHTFFSLAFAVVAWVGPGVAAMTIASERSGRTWEPLLLTGMGPRAIARGKFLASLTYIAMYLVALAPVGALPFLFGGVTALEVVAAFLLLGLLSALSVGFGLSVSSAVSSPGLAAVVTLPIAVALSIGAYVTLGVALSYLVHELWPAVVEGAPVWLPTAYVRAPLSWEYLVYLVFVPIGSIGLLAWFFFENTVANMQDTNDDRTSGLKLWLLVAVPSFAAMAVSIGAVVGGADGWGAALGGMAWIGAFMLLATFLFVGDALEPSERVRAAWERDATGPARRLLGPGVVGTMTLVMMLGLGAFALLAVAGALLEHRSGGTWHSSKTGALIVVAAYGSSFLVFLCGLATWLRGNAQRPLAARLLLLLATFLAFVGPWIAVALSSVLVDSDVGLLVAAPSPFYAGVMVEALDRTSATAQTRIAVGATAIACWATLGLVFHGLGARRTTALCRSLAEERARLESGELTGARE